MKTSYWETLTIFKKPINGENISFKESPSPIPAEVEKLVQADWEIQLQNKMKSLSAEKSNLSIKPYKTGNLNALYEGEKAIMWPGPTISLTDINEEKDGVVLSAFQTAFPSIAALSKPEIKSILEKNNIGLIRPSLAICTFAITSDNQIVLTVRGAKTNMYPGRLYGQGGNPLYVSETPVTHQEHEMKDEILVNPADVVPNTLQFGGIAADMHQLTNKPDLLGWVSLKINSEEVKKRISERSADKRPNDSIGIVLVPSDENGLYDFLVNRSHAVQFCPPAHAGLLLYGYHHFGQKWSDDVLKNLVL